MVPILTAFLKFPGICRGKKVEKGLYFIVLHIKLYTYIKILYILLFACRQRSSKRISKRLQQKKRKINRNVICVAIAFSFDVQKLYELYELFFVNKIITFLKKINSKSIKMSHAIRNKW